MRESIGRTNGQHTAHKSGKNTTNPIAMTIELHIVDHNTQHTTPISFIIKNIPNLKIDFSLLFHILDAM